MLTEKCQGTVKEEPMACFGETGRTTDSRKHGKE